MIYQIETKDRLTGRIFMSVIICMHSQKKAIEIHLNNHLPPIERTPEEYMDHSIKEIDRKTAYQMNLTVPLIYDKKSAEYHGFIFECETVGSKINYESCSEPGFKEPATRHAIAPRV